ncbi:hypothetical protein AB0D33_38410 [Streptomyces sp. NPDC048404]|uniref:hypothetical protein n=1 Tax=unclassified Streptomyces TaxID=2593676 RepID=UPI003426B3C1
MPADDATAAGAVIVHAGRVLMIRRNVPAGSLLWTFPQLGDLHRLVPDGVFEPVRTYLDNVLPH